MEIDIVLDSHLSSGELTELGLLAEKYGIRCLWNAGGKVNHWGHVHTRVNQYDATFVVEVVGGSWKITAQEFTGAKRLG